MRRYVMPALKTSFGILLVLWVAEVALNLGMVARLFLGDPLPATARDFAGLFILEVQVAIALGAMAWMLAPVAAVVLRTRDVLREAMPLAAGGIVAVLIVASSRFHWGLTTGQSALSLLLGASIGLLSWVALRLCAARLQMTLSGFGVLTGFLAFPALLIGFANLALAKAVHGHVGEALIAGIAVVVVGAAARIAFSSKSGVLRQMALWFPPVFVFLAAVHAVISFASYGGAAGNVDRGQASHLPNIVLIVLDTARADHLKQYGYARDTMPQLEAWGKKGLVFNRAISPGAWTTPSHASMFSGRPVSLHGMHSGSTRTDFYTRRFPDIPWLPQELVANGYYCLAISDNTIAVPSGIGFDRVLIPNRREWWLDTAAGLVDDHVSPVLRSISAKLRWRMPYVGAKAIVDIAMRALPERDGPTFLFINFLDAHGPYNPPSSALAGLGLTPPNLAGRYLSHRTLTRMWTSLPERRYQYMKDLYDGELFGLDRQLARLLDWIDERLGEDAIVIVTSDHGEELGEEGRVGHEFGVMQSLVHVPLFVRIPGEPPRQINDIVSTRMVYAFIEQASTGAKPDVDLLTGGDEIGVVCERYRSFSEVARGGKAYDRYWVGMFDDDIKVVGPTEYGADIFELGPLFRDETRIPRNERSDALAGRIDEYWDTYRDRRDETGMEKLSEDELNRLRALGYIK